MTERLGLTAIWAAVAVGAAATAGGLGLVGSQRPVEPYLAPQYWVDYDHGFIRRGLPGAVLRLLVGSPTLGDVRAAELLMCLAALASCLVLTVGVCRHAGAPLRAATLAVILVWSPLTFSLFVRDFGRYDAVGVMCLALVVLTSRIKGAYVSVALMATALAAACAAEEFLFIIIAPVVFVAVNGTRLVKTVAVLPGFVVAAASMLVPAPHGAIVAANHGAAAQGVRVGRLNAANTLGMSTSESRRLFFHYYPEHELVAAIALWSLLALATFAAVWLLSRRVSAVAVAAAVSSGLVLTVLGIDTRRWWGLAMLELAAWIAVTRTDRQRAASWRAALPLAALIVAVSVVTRFLPVDHIPPNATDVSKRHLLLGRP